jgi:hypothetical protein
MADAHDITVDDDESVVSDAMEALLTHVDARDKPTSFTTPELDTILEHFGVDIIGQGSRILNSFDDGMRDYLWQLRKLRRSRTHDEKRKQLRKTNPEWKAQEAKRDAKKHEAKRKRMAEDSDYQNKQLEMDKARCHAYRERLRNERPEEYQVLRDRANLLRRTEQYRAAKREKYAANPEKYRAAGRKSYAAHKDDPVWVKKRREHAGKNAEFYPWHNVVHRINVLKCRFDVDRDYIMALVQQPCFYCATTTAMRGVDRKDPGRGYFKDNCVAACRQCNIHKGTNSVETFIAMAHDITTHLADSSYVSALTFAAKSHLSFNTWKQKQISCRKIEVHITEAEYKALLTGDCVYCGLKLANGIDRLKSSGHYEMSNVQSCCMACNYLHHIYDHDEFVAKLHAIIAVHPMRPVNAPISTPMVHFEHNADGSYVLAENGNRMCTECGIRRKISRFFDGNAKVCTRCVMAYADEDKTTEVKDDSDMDSDDIPLSHMIKNLAAAASKNTDAASSADPPSD